MRLLVLGGTQFVGYHIVGAALGRGHDVTTFTRGQTRPDAWPKAESLHGDRDGDLSALEGGSWDAVIDTCGYVPRVVRRSVELLSPAVTHYIFISTESVYADLSGTGIDEVAALASMPDESVEEITEETYGPLKVLCEQVVTAAMPETSLIVRPGYVVGPRDHTDRFTYWVRRIAHGGEVLGPGPAERPFQVIDGRDMGEWIIAMTERRDAGVFNASGPDYRLTFDAMLEDCRKATGSDARVTWVDDALLARAGVTPDDLPLWEPAEGGSLGGFEADSSRAIAAGLTFRPLVETAIDTLEWDRTEGHGSSGLTRAREQKLLASLRQ
ncbi:MAG: NAD-dependent epimerase/dehydratase family protein [Actinobacteria bacterium]|nr:NAD-dependent epimerase/dehydratase family protein [Actinomycetota bacterium]